MSFFKLIDLTSLLFTQIDYSNNHYSIYQLYATGYSLSDLYRSGYSVYDLSGLYYYGYLSGSDFINSIIPANGLSQIMNTITFPLSPIMKYYLSNPTLKTSIQKLFQIYSIIDIYSNSVSILQQQNVQISDIGINLLTFMHNNDITINQIYPLINNLQLFPIISINQLQKGNYTLSEILLLITINSNLYSYSSIYQSLNFKIIDFYNANVSAASMKTIEIINNINIQQITPATLYSNGYSFNDLYNAGYTAVDFSNSGFTITNLFDGGLSVAQIRNIYKQNITLDDLVIKYDASLPQIVEAGYTLTEILPYKITYYPITDFLLLYSLQQLYNVGFKPIDLYIGTIINGNPTVPQILNLGYDVSFIIPLDIQIIDYYNANYSSLSLFNNGFNINILTNNYSLLNFKRDNIPIYQLYLSNAYLSSAYILAGYILSEFYNSGVPIGFIVSYFPIIEVINIGYTIESIIATRNYPASDFFILKYSSALLAGYYTIDELFAGGYSRKDLNIEGNNINQYCLKTQCNQYLPTKLGSSFNQNRISKKVSYSQSITTRSGGSYTTSYSSYTTNNTTTIVPEVCPDTFTLKTLAAGTSCKSINIPSKTSAVFSNFIRNYIKQQVYLYNTNLTSSQLDTITITAINNINILQKSNPNVPIYTIIKNYFNPSTIIISDPF